MPETTTERRVKELEKRVETLELMVDEKLRKKVEKGLEDEKEGRLISLEDYESEEAS